MVDSFVRRALHHPKLATILQEDLEQRAIPEVTGDAAEMDRGSGRTTGQTGVAWPRLAVGRLSIRTLCEGRTDFSGSSPAGSAAGCQELR